MKRSYQIGIETRELYNFEDTVLIHDIDLNKQRSYRFLIKEATKIWKQSGTKKKLPNIVFGKGTMFNGRPLSYCIGFSYIELCPGQRDILTLLHELVHAMGPVNHGKTFRKRYFDLLYKYI